MKKHIMKKAMAVVLSCAMVGVMGGCSLPFGQKEKEEEEALEIQASVSKVKIEVGEEDEIEIENFEDLSKLKFEVEDEDIATVEEDDDGVFVVTGVSEGKTSVTFTAKECEDLVIKITVEGGLEPQPTSGGTTFELSAYDMTVDYDDYDAYLYITNWDDIKDVAGDTISVTSSDPDTLYVSSWPNDDGSIWLSVYEEGVVTVTIEAEGFDPAYCTVECTHEGGSGDGNYTTGGVDINNDGTINLWNVANNFVVCTVTNPIDYTLDDLNSSEGSIFFDSDFISGSYITIWSDCPMEMWNYLQGNDPEDGDGTLHADYELTDITKIGTFNGEDVYVAWRTDPDNIWGEYDMVEMWFEYNAGSYDDYVTIELYPELVEDYDEDDFWTLFSQMFDN